MQKRSKPHVVVIGGGAAGVFTGYLLAKNAKDEFDITILERADRVGGHTVSFKAPEESENFKIDGGAQFFSETSEPLYCKMLREEKLTGVLLERSVGMTVWNVTTKKFAFRVPATLEALTKEAMSNPGSWAQFLLFCAEAAILYGKRDWKTTFGEWLTGLGLSDEFKSNIARPLMYQFGLVKPADLDALSALFVVFFFVRSFPWQLPSRPTRLDAGVFTVYNSEIGLDGILMRLIKQYDLQVRLSSEVRSIHRSGEEYHITNVSGDVIVADEVVFAINPSRILDVLPREPELESLRSVLEKMPYTTVPAVVEKVSGKASPKYMPWRKFMKQWEVSNVLVVDSSAEAGAHPVSYMLGVWFGPMRKEKGAAAYFKAWGSPALDPAPQESVNSQNHELMTGTPEFMTNRKKLASHYQGRDHLWFTGGYVLNYDSQDSCLESAANVVKKLIKRHAPDVLKAEGTFLIGTDAPVEPVTDRLPALFELLAAIVIQAESVAPYADALRDHFPNLN